MEFIYNCIWEKNGRAQNEDALTLRHVTKEGKEYLLAVVCDGIGGLPEGENASSFVADSLGREMMRLLETDKSMGMKKWRNAFLHEIYRCHQLLQFYGKEKGIRLGTTLSMVFICEKKGYLFQVGDSAVFVGKHYLKRRTEIHRTKKGALKQAVGIGRRMKVEWKRLYVRKGSVFLLASDGFYQNVEWELTGSGVLKEWKRKTVGETEIDIWLRNKHRLAKQRGERDNSSAICVLYGGSRK